LIQCTHQRGVVMANQKTGRESTEQLARSLKIGRRVRVFDDDEVRRLLRAAVEREGNQSAFSKNTGADRTHINQVLNGRKPISDRIVKALRLRRTYILDEK
jgi:hypothetical protein